MANTFLTDKQISENCFIVELEKKRCSCSTPLQVAYFTMDNSKYFYLNAYYNFLTPCLDMDYIHVIYGDTDSQCLAIAHESWPIKDKKLWDELYSQLFPSASNDNYYDKKKILGWNIESESTTCLALAPKCFYMENQRDTLADITSVIQERIGISGINTKTIVLRNQACAPYIHGLKSSQYKIDN
ncbi:MAG: hypothetical protein EZS28_042200 [Streblomastix strix]|uniref:Uncharacterized protein n=1 Tax=Streblomastix strix TaxID=222440 RepID=A0A5J4TWH9_9EUKA|nr:MAG: hypothetical protein EZS28_042200 [Streblomastix strix]